uniref:SFRICE_031029 n=1 Tax=Spodoptera frugiperda TaxID=7108 RepID=A0A2H1VE80_SPOFR
MNNTLKVSVHRPASHATGCNMSCIETHTTASTDPHRTDRIIGNVYMRCVLMTSYGMLMPKIRVKVVLAIRLLILVSTQSIRLMRSVRCCKVFLPREKQL